MATALHNGSIARDEIAGLHKKNTPAGRGIFKELSS